MDVPENIHCHTNRVDERISVSTLPTPIDFPTDWGRIKKGEVIDQLFEKNIAELQRLYHLEGQTHSVALGIMEPGAFHEPYIRCATPSGQKIDQRNMRVYVILEGSFRAVRDGERKTFSSHTGYIVVGELDPFSFQAGKDGCVFGIIDFPAFDLTFDVNNVTRKNIPGKAS